MASNLQRAELAERLAAALVDILDALLDAREPRGEPPADAPPPPPPLADLPPLVPAWPDAARLLGCARNRVFELSRAGQLPTLRLGRRLYVRRADLEQLLAPAPPTAMRPSGAGPVPLTRRRAAR